MKRIVAVMALITFCFAGLAFSADKVVVVPLGADGCYAIGDTGPAGGIVFYIEGGGSCGEHGLEAAPADQSSGAEWGCYGTEIGGADGTAVGTGTQNSINIAMNCSDSSIAAKIAESYTLNGIGGWFLPSKDELNELYKQRSVVGGFTDDGYWSSSQYSGNAAWGHYFGSGNQQSYLKYNFGLGVRAIRAF